MPPRKKAKHQRTQSGSRAALKTTSVDGDAAPSAVAKTQTTMAPPANLPDRRGGHGKLLDVPLDIMIEIFSFMHVRDLLSMARTSKVFRAFLMSRHSAPFWRAARQQVEGPFPACPPFLSEPAYANLVFFSHCHSCTRPNVKTVIWEFLARYCPTCRADMLRDKDDMNYYYFQTRHELRNCFNVYRTRSSLDNEILFHGPEVDEYLVKFERYPQADGFAEFVKQATEDVKLRKQFAQAMRDWESHRDHLRLAEVHAIKEARLQGVKQRLCDEGWGQEFDIMADSAFSDFKKLKPLRQPRQLTERAWQSMRGEVAAFMEKTRVDRLGREQAALRTRRLTLLSEVFTEWEDTKFGLGRFRELPHDRDYYAAFADLALTGVFRTLIEAPSDTEVNKATLQEHSDEIDSHTNRWYEQRLAELIDMVTKVIVVAAPDGVSPLSLAVATFDCRVCARTGMRWQSVLAHHCARSMADCRTYNTTDEGYKEHLLATCQQLGQPGMWTNVFVFNSLQGRIRAAITACGQDPDTATYAEMEACRVRLICKTCMSGKRECDVYDWKAAARHGCRVLNNKPKHQLRVVEQHPFAFGRLDPQDVRSVLMLEPDWQYRSLREYFRSGQGHFGCTRCRVYLDAAQVAAHCTSKHQVVQPMEQVDYYEHVDIHHDAEPIRIYAPGREGKAAVKAHVTRGGVAFMSPSPFTQLQ